MKTVAEMAREAGLEGMTENPALHYFAARARAAEREACAKVCYEVFDKTGLWAALQLSDKIRARGSKPTAVIYSPGQLAERGLTHEDVVKLIKGKNI